MRLGWETAGDLGRATRWDLSRAATTLPDDAALEHGLTAMAVQDLAAVDGVAVAALRGFVGGASAARQSLGEADLVDRGLLWRPPTGGPLRPVPWAARALASTAAGAERRALRGAMVCAPLARAVAGRCLDLEGTVRPRWSPVGAPDPETAGAWDRFRPEPSRDREHYPPGCLAVPADAWDLASMGAYLQATVLPPRAREALHDLRLLRNAVMHGHYVSWQSLRRLWQIEEYLAPAEGALSTRTR